MSARQEKYQNLIFAALTADFENAPGVLSVTSLHFIATINIMI
jgi:hypothetical protein